MIRVGVITVSDRASRGEAKDKSGQVIKDMVKRIGGEPVVYGLIPDETELIKDQLIKMCDELELDLIITTGGTGLGPRDVTPDATLQVIHKQVPGICEVMRAGGFEKTPHALLSRAVAGIRGQSLIINLPGSPRAVEEGLNIVLPALPHAIEVLKGEATECSPHSPLDNEQG